MGSPNISCFILLFFALASMIPTLTANVAHWDEYWLKQKAEAQKNSLTVFDESRKGNVVLDDLYKKKAVEAKAMAMVNSETKGKTEAGADLKAEVEAEAQLKRFEKFKTDAEAEAKAAEAKATPKKTKVEAKSSPLSSNSTRRALRGRRYSGPCRAINSIDKCWRCDKNWALNRKRLADCARGFGQKAQGGKNGRIYVVTDPSDNDVVNPKPGTLRHAVIQLEPLWIIFARSMTIKLSQELIMTSDKTIDARGANVHIAYGAGITMQFVKNIIVHNLHVHHIVESSGGMIRDSVNHVGFRTHNEGDGISIFGAQDIWLDHLSMSRCKDGLIDAVQGSTAITISNSHFTDHDKVMLFGASDLTTVDDKMQITVAFNHFGKRLVQRMPRCRSGFFHLVNNDYTHWEMYAIGGSHHATIISQGNRFIAPPNLPDSRKSMLEITHRNPGDNWKSWTWVSDGDIFQNGAFFIPSGDLNGAKTYAALELIKASPASQVGRLTRFSGALPCRQGRPC